MNVINNMTIFKSLMEQLPQKVLWVNEDLIILGCSESLSRNLGFRNSMEITGKSFFDIITDKEDAQKIYDLHKKTFESNSPLYNMVDTYSNSDGSRELVKLDLIPLRNEEGEAKGVLTIMNDISEKRYLEDKLSKNEDKYKNLIDFTNTAFFILNIEMKIIEANQLFLDMVGEKTLSDIIGLNPRLWVSAKNVEMFDEAFKALINNNEIIKELEVVFISESNKPVFTVINANILENGAKKILCLLRDISDKASEKNSLFIEKEKRKDVIRQSVQDIKGNILKIKLLSV